MFDPVAWLVGLMLLLISVVRVRDLLDVPILPATVPSADENCTVTLDELAWFIWTAKIALVVPMSPSVTVISATVIWG